MPRKYIIAHLSDLHLTARNSDSRYEPSLPHDRLKGMNHSFKTLLANRSIREADHIVITGDITDKGELNAWKKFRQYLQLVKLDHKTSIVIGNHDICELGSINLNFTNRQKWNQIKTARTTLKRRLSAINRKYDYPYARLLRDDIILFGLDSNNAANIGDVDNAIGIIGQKQLSIFAGLLRKNQHIPVKIVALHHSPNLAENSVHVKHLSWFEKKFTRYTHQIPQGQRRSLRLLCKTHGVKRIIHGHMHDTHDRTLDVRIVGAPSSTQPEFDEEQYWLHYIEYHVTTSSAGVKRVRNVKKKIAINPEFEKLSFVEYYSRQLVRIFIATLVTVLRK